MVNLTVKRQNVKKMVDIKTQTPYPHPPTHTKSTIFHGTSRRSQIIVNWGSNIDGVNDDVWVTSCISEYKLYTNFTWWKHLRTLFSSLCRQQMCQSRSLRWPSITVSITKKEKDKPVTCMYTNSFYPFNCLNFVRKK